MSAALRPFRSAAPGLARGAWLLVGLLWVVALLNYLDRQVLVTMRDAIRQDIPMSDAQFGMLTSVFLWVYGALSPVGGYLADRYGRRPVIFVSLSAWALTTWLTGHVRSYEQLLGARALMGVSEACYIPAALAFITDHHRDRTRSLATGLHMTGIYCGMVLGGLGGFLALPGKPLMGLNLFVGWQNVYLGFGLFGAAYSALLMLSLPREAPAGEVAASEPLREGSVAGLWRDGRFLLLLVVVALIGACNWVVIGWLPSLVKDRFGLEAGPAGLHATAWVTLAKFFAVIGGGLLSDRLSQKTERARALVPAFGLLLAAPGIFWATGTEVLAFGLLGFALQGVAQGFMDANLMPMLRQVGGRRVAATGYGLLNFVSCAAGGIMIAFGGRLRDSGPGFEPLFRFAAAGLAAAAVMILFFRPKRAVA